MHSEFTLRSGIRGTGGTSPNPPRVTIIIPTFRRPLLLRECISSCLRQKGTDSGAYEILVVDNCPDGSASSVVAEISHSALTPIHYIREAKPGVSAARNAGLRYARGELVAFIDDDETATENWLAHLLATQLRTKADVVFGPVFPMLPEATDPIQRAFFERFLTHCTNHSTGTQVKSRLLTPFWVRGPHAYPSLASGNCLIYRRSRSVEAVHFDDRLGRFGGEDALYFNQLAVNGAYFVWCAEAIAWEYIPPERLCLSYALTRAIRGGQVVSWIPMLLSPSKPALTGLSMSIAFVQLPFFAVLAGGSAMFGATNRYYYLARLASAIGKLFWASPFRGRAWPSWRRRSQAG